MARTFNVAPDSLNTLQLRATQPHPAFRVGEGCFASGSALPSPAIAGPLRQLFEDLDSHPNHKTSVFAHTDASGGNKANKALSDLRGKALVAVMTDDPALFIAVGEAAAWDVVDYQLMLRGLYCNPGAMDGVLGGLTESAIQTFQRQYNRGLFHKEGRAPVLSNIEVTGALDPDTRHALCDGYVAEHTVQLSAGRLIGPRFSGCSEFNPIFDRAPDNRRVSLGLYSSHQPASSEFPCTEGDSGPCPLDNEGPPRCRFY
ncbi:MAG: hypothetical protein JKY37_12070, partial [Nannocystaceae bacterium]|nr:hypothetical protein [Nannocystaceae bacterium]